MSVLRFSFRTTGIKKQILAATDPRKIILRTNARVCLLSDLGNLLPYHENRSSLEEADYIVVLSANAEGIPQMLMHLAKNLCPHGNFVVTYEEGEKQVKRKIDEIVMKMHEQTPANEQAVIWQRYFHAISQATPDAHNVFLRMAQNMGVIPMVFVEKHYVVTNHLNPVTGRIIDWTSSEPRRGHNYGGFLK